MRMEGTSASTKTFKRAVLKNPSLCVVLVRLYIILHPSPILRFSVCCTRARHLLAFGQGISHWAVGKRGLAFSIG